MTHLSRSGGLHWDGKYILFLPGHWPKAVMITNFHIVLHNTLLLRSPCARLLRNSKIVAIGYRSTDGRPCNVGGEHCEPSFLYHF